MQRKGLKSRDLRAEVKMFRSCPVGGWVGEPFCKTQMDIILFLIGEQHRRAPIVPLIATQPRHWLTAVKSCLCLEQGAADRLSTSPHISFPGLFIFSAYRAVLWLNGNLSLSKSSFCLSPPGPVLPASRIFLQGLIWSSWWWFHLPKNDTRGFLPFGCFMSSIFNTEPCLYSSLPIQWACSFTQRYLLRQLHPKFHQLFQSITSLTYQLHPVSVPFTYLLDSSIFSKILHYSKAKAKWGRSVNKRFVQSGDPIFMLSASTLSAKYISTVDR